MVLGCFDRPVHMVFGNDWCVLIGACAVNGKNTVHNFDFNNSTTT